MTFFAKRIILDVSQVFLNMPLNSIVQVVLCCAVTFTITIFMFE